MIDALEALAILAVFVAAVGGGYIFMLGVGWVITWWEDME